MGNNPVNGVDPDGREWYSNWFGGQKWFDTSSKNSLFWKMNPNGEYHLGNGVYIRTEKPTEIYGRIPVYLKNDQLNPNHSEYRWRMWLERGMQDNRDWTYDKGFKEKGLPTMALTATTVFTGGLVVSGQFSAYYAGTKGVIALGADGLDVLNNIHTLAGSPLYGAGGSATVNFGNVVLNVDMVRATGIMTINPLSPLFSTAGLAVDIHTLKK